MEKAAKYQEEISKAIDNPTQPPPDQQGQDRLSCEYYILRTVLAWRQSNSSMADYMYSKATELLEPRSAEKLVSALYEIGHELLQLNVFDAAIKWLQRSFEVIDGVDPVMLSPGGAELRLAVMHNLGAIPIS
jgi:tetratricopeptide (TPR) repeat protein